MTKVERNPNDDAQMPRPWAGRLLIIGSLALLAFGSGEKAAVGQLPLPKKASATSNAAGQSAVPGENQTPATTAQSIEAKLAEVRAKLAAAEEQGDAGLTNAPAGVSPQDITVRRALLHRLVRLLEQQLTSLAELEAAKSRREEADRAAQTWTRFAESPPY